MTPLEAESLRDMPLSNGGTLGALVADAGLEWDETLARIGIKTDSRYVLQLHREKAAKREALPVYNGPPPATIAEADALIGETGRTYSSLSAETTAAIIHLRGEASAAGTPEGEGGDDRRKSYPSDARAVPLPCPPENPKSYEEPSPEADPTAPHDHRISSTLPSPRPVPEPIGEGLPVLLWGDVTMKVYPETRNTYPVEFVRGDVRICIEAPKSPPWLSNRLQDRLVAGLASALGDEGRPKEFMRRKVGEAFTEIAKKLETDDGTKRALTPAAVRTVIERTERVTVYPATDGGHYEIVISGKALVLTTAQMARKIPDGDGGFNHRWLNLFPTDEIDATKSDWKAIKAYWYEIAEVREVEEATEAETVIDRLVEDLERVSLVPDPEGMTGPDFAWHDEKKGVVWVHARRIARFLEELKRPGWNDGKLSATLQAEGYTFGKTKLQRIGLDARKGGRQTRCWPFKPGLIEFRPATARPLEVRDCVDQ